MGTSITSGALPDHELHQRKHGDLPLPITPWTFASHHSSSGTSSSQRRSGRTSRTQLAAKASQATQVNKHRVPELSLRIGDKVMLSTKHRRREYMQKGDNRVAKFMPRFDGPYTITDAHPETSMYTLDLPNSPNIFPTFHSSQLKLFHANDSILFPSREFPRPGPVVTANGQMETFIEKIVDEKRVGRGKRYLVRWVGFGADEDEWLPRRDLEDCEALDVWEQRTNSSWGGRV